MTIFSYPRFWVDGAGKGFNRNFLMQMEKKGSHKNGAEQSTIII